MSIEHTEPIRLRTACEEDAEALLDIYAPYVEHTAVSFEFPHGVSQPQQGLEIRN